MLRLHPLDQLKQQVGLRPLKGQRGVLAFVGHSKGIPDPGQSLLSKVLRHLLLLAFLVTRTGLITLFAALMRHLFAPFPFTPSGYVAEELSLFSSNRFPMYLFIMQNLSCLSLSG